MVEFLYDIEKDKKLQKERFISFDEVIEFIEADCIIDIKDHPMKFKYPHQKIYLIDINDYVWIVPYIRNEDKIFLKTAYKSRKYTKLYKKTNKENKDEQENNQTNIKPLRPRRTRDTRLV